MNTSLWAGTPVEKIVQEAWQSPTSRMMYFVGQIEQSTFEIFGVLPDSEAEPEAILFARALLMALMAPPDQREALTEKAQAIVAHWRAQREVH